MSIWDVIHFDVSGEFLKTGLSTDQVQAQLRAGIIAWVDFAKPVTGPDDWRRIFEISEFQKHLPAFPDLTRLMQRDSSTRKGKGKVGKALAAAKTVAAGDIHPEESTLGVALPESEAEKYKWFIQYSSSQFGPFEVEELEMVLRSGKLQGDIYLWCERLDNWMPLSAFPWLAEISPIQTGLAKKKPRKKRSNLEILRKREERGNLRCPLIATVSLGGIEEAGDSFVGVVGDISETGVQVIIDSDQRFDGKSKLVLSIFPLGITGLSPFEATVQLSWVNLKERKAGFRFAEVPEADRQALDAYLKSARERRKAPGTLPPAIGQAEQDEPKIELETRTTRKPGPA